MFGQESGRILRVSVFFFLAFLAVGIAIDLLANGGSVDWGHRLLVAAIATGVYFVAQLLGLGRRDRGDGEG